MEKYYTSSRLLSVTLIFLTVTCLYILASYTEQSNVLRKARIDFGWWFVFDQLQKDPKRYEGYMAGKPHSEKLFLYSYYESLGHCFAREVGSYLHVEISKNDFDLSSIEPSFYAPVRDMPFWTIDLNLRDYEPTELTDLTFKLILYASKQEGGTLKDADLVDERLGLEGLKRLKQV